MTVDLFNSRDFSQVPREVGRIWQAAAGKFLLVAHQVDCSRDGLREFIQANRIFSEELQQVLELWDAECPEPAPRSDEPGS